MNYDSRSELYQQVILEHNKNPRNFYALNPSTHCAEGYNPLCGDHMHVYLNVNEKNIIEGISFVGDGCAISKASASMMTESLKGKNVDEAKLLFEEFIHLIKGELDLSKSGHQLGKLAIFSGIWHFPMRVKCASLSWHTMKAAVDKKAQPVSTE